MSLHPDFLGDTGFDPRKKQKGKSLPHRSQDFKFCWRYFHKIIAIGTISLVFIDVDDEWIVIVIILYTCQKIISTNNGDFLRWTIMGRLVNNRSCYSGALNQIICRSCATWTTLKNKRFYVPCEFWLVVILNMWVLHVDLHHFTLIPIEKMKFWNMSWFFDFFWVAWFEPLHSMNHSDTCVHTDFASKILLWVFLKINYTEKFARI